MTRVIWPRVVRCNCGKAMVAKLIRCGEHFDVECFDHAKGVPLYRSDLGEVVARAWHQDTWVFNRGYRAFTMSIPVSCPQCPAVVFAKWAGDLAREIDRVVERGRMGQSVPAATEPPKPKKLPRRRIYVGGAG